MARSTIKTSNKEIYDKLNMLHFSSEVILKDVLRMDIERVLSKVNKSSKVLDMEEIGKYFLIKKSNPMNVNIYYQKNYKGR